MYKASIIITVTLNIQLLCIFMYRMTTNKALCIIWEEVVILQYERCSTGLYHKMLPQNHIQTSFTQLQAGLDLSHKRRYLFISNDLQFWFDHRCVLLTATGRQGAEKYTSTFRHSNLQMLAHSDKLESCHQWLIKAVTRVQSISKEKTLPLLFFFLQNVPFTGVPERLK